MDQVNPILGGKNPILGRKKILFWGGKKALGFRNPFQQELEKLWNFFCSCSFFGKSTLRAGSGTEDAQCSPGGPGSAIVPGLDPLPTEFPGNRDPVPTEFPENKDPVPTGFLEPSAPSVPGDVPSVCLEPGNPTEPAWGKDGNSWEFKSRFFGSFSWFLHAAFQDPTFPWKAAFLGIQIPLFQKLFLVLYTAFQDPTFPWKAAFLGSQIPLFPKPFLFFTHSFPIFHISIWSCFPGN